MLFRSTLSDHDCQGSLLAGAGAFCAEATPAIARSVRHAHIAFLIAATYSEYASGRLSDCPCYPPTLADRTPVRDFAHCECTSAVFKNSSGNLTGEQVVSLKGLWAYARSIEPEFIPVLRNEWGGPKRSSKGSVELTCSLHSTGAAKGWAIRRDSQGRFATDLASPESSRMTMPVLARSTP